YPATGLSDFALHWMAERAQRHGLELDLDVLDPKIRADEREAPQDSQTFGYRTIGALKKLNAHTVGVGLTKDEIADLTHSVDWFGNYHRPVPKARPALKKAPATVRRVV